MYLSKWKGCEIFRALLVIQVYLGGMEMLELRYAVTVPLSLMFLLTVLLLAHVIFLC